MVDALFLIGRFLYGLLFVVSGIAGHLVAYQQLKGYAAAKKFPLAGPAVLVSGVGIILGGVGIIVGVWPTWRRSGSPCSCSSRRSSSTTSGPSRTT